MQFWKSKSFFFYLCKLVFGFSTPRKWIFVIMIFLSTLLDLLPKLRNFSRSTSQQKNRDLWGELYFYEIVKQNHLLSSKRDCQAFLGLEKKSKVWCCGNFFIHPKVKVAKWLIIGNEELLLKLHCTKIYEKSHMHTHKWAWKFKMSAIC